MILKILFPSLPPFLSLFPYSITRFIKKFISLFLIQQTQKEHLPFSRLNNLWNFWFHRSTKSWQHEVAFDSWVRKICWRKDRLPTPAFSGFPCGSAGKESTCNTGDLHSIPGLRWSTGEGKGYSFQYFWPREVHGLYSPKESDTTEWLPLTHSYTSAPSNFYHLYLAQHLQCENSRKAKIFFCSLLYSQYT